MRGFTIVELMTVLVVFALLLFVAIPNIASWMNNVRVRTTAETIASGINQARVEAIKRNMTVSFWLVTASAASSAVLDATCVRSTASSSWVVSLDDPTGQCEQSPSATTAPRIVSSNAAGSNGTSVQIAAVDLSSTASSVVAFNGYGQPVTGVGGLSIQHIDVSSSTAGSRRLRLEISTGGDVRMCDRDVVFTSTDPRKCLNDPSL
jgi:type IV fimbrial biogenesis protein FimT